MVAGCNMYSGFNRLTVGFNILLACVLVPLLVAWVLGMMGTGHDVREACA